MFISIGQTVLNFFSEMRPNRILQITYICDTSFAILKMQNHSPCLCLTGNTPSPLPKQHARSNSDCQMELIRRT